MLGPGARWGDSCTSADAPAPVREICAAMAASQAGRGGGCMLTSEKFNISSLHLAPLEPIELTPARLEKLGGMMRSQLTPELVAERLGADAVKWLVEPSVLADCVGLVHEANSRAKVSGRVVRPCE